jgi:hypothetical protein
MGTGGTNVDAAVPAVPGVPNENGQFSNTETGLFPEQETEKKQLLRWIGVRCAWSKDVWGSEESLYQDHREWCSEYNQPPCPRDLFCTILSEWFQRSAEGWQGLCIAADWRLSEGKTGNRSDVRHSGTERIQ